MGSDPLSDARAAATAAGEALATARANASAASSTAQSLRARLSGGDATVTGSDLTAADGEVETTALLATAAERAAQEAQEALVSEQKRALAAEVAEWRASAPATLPDLRAAAVAAIRAFVAEAASFNLAASEYVARARDLGSLPGVIDAPSGYGVTTFAGVGKLENITITEAAYDVLADGMDGLAAPAAVKNLRAMAGLTGRPLPT